MSKQWELDRELGEKIRATFPDEEKDLIKAFEKALERVGNPDKVEDWSETDPDWWWGDGEIL